LVLVLSSVMNVAAETGKAIAALIGGVSTAANERPSQHEKVHRLLREHLVVVA
jgi:hypothetical protein